MSERLTADGWEPAVDPWGKLVKGKPFVHLDRAQAIADERDKFERQRNELRSQVCETSAEIESLRHRLMSAASEIDDLQKTLAFQNAIKLIGERNALRAELDAVRKERDEARAREWSINARNASQRKANARMQAEYDAPNAKYELARQNMIRDVRAARKERDEASQRAEAAEARAERLRVALRDQPCACKSSGIDSETHWEWVCPRCDALADEPQPPRPDDRARGRGCRDE